VCGEQADGAQGNEVDDVQATRPAAIAEEENGDPLTRGLGDLTGHHNRYEVWGTIAPSNTLIISAQAMLS
jgi:hypothetical protein